MKKVMHNEPLLYIAQPTVGKPKSYMQAEFNSGQNEVQQRQGETERNQKVNSQTAAMKGNSNVNESENLPNDTESFKGLSLTEKINYLNEIPTDYFQMKCKFTTKEKTYYGMLTAKDETTIEIIHSGRQRTKLAIADLLEISLIGL